MRLILNPLSGKADRASFVVLMTNILLKMHLLFCQKFIQKNKIFALIY